MSPVSARVNIDVDENHEKRQGIGVGSDNVCSVSLPNRIQRRALVFGDLPAERRQAIKARFWAKVRKTGTCWIWTAGCQKRMPYGQFTFRVDGQQEHISAHRFAWLLTYGAFPVDLNICHHCDNPPCVRPSHLFLGSQDANLKDAAGKDRFTVPRRKKLTLAERLDIFHAPLDRKTGGELARQYGVSKVAIHFIRRGRFIGSGVWGGTKHPEETLRAPHANSYRPSEKLCRSVKAG